MPNASTGQKNCSFLRTLSPGLLPGLIPAPYIVPMTPRFWTHLDANRAVAHVSLSSPMFLSFSSTEIFLSVMLLPNTIVFVLSSLVVIHNAFPLHLADSITNLSSFPSSSSITSMSSANFRFTKSRSMNRNSLFVCAGFVSGSFRINNEDTSTCIYLFIYLFIYHENEYRTKVHKNKKIKTHIR